MRVNKRKRALKSINKDYKYRVYVWDKDGAITDFGLIKLNNDGSINIELPDSKTLIADNKTYIRIVNEENGGSVKGVIVNVTDGAGNSASDKTNSNGIAVVPVSDGDFTDADGNASVTDADGKIFNVNVSDEKGGNIENAYVKIADGKITVTLPDGKVLTTDNQTTVSVTDKENTPVSNMSVTVTDNKNNSATKPTDANGRITVPIKTSSGGSGGGSSSGGGSRSGGGGGGSSVVKTTYVVTVTDKDGKPVTVSKTEKDGLITLTLPSGKLINIDGYYTIVVKDSKGNIQPNISVTLKDKKNNSVSGVTDANGTLVVPTAEHKAYVYGYEDGEFKPEGNMTRAEAAAIFARNIALRKGEVIPEKKSKFTDVNRKLWYSSPIAYLAKYEVISGYSDGTFKPEEQITRAEFVSMVTRFYDLFNTVSSSGKNGFTDVAKSHWAYSYINSAASMNWIAGYADGTFRPDNNIKRTEVVAIVNRVTDRAADKEWIRHYLTAAVVRTQRRMRLF